MKGYGLLYYIAEAFRGLRANSLVNMLAVGSITMAMLIVGFFLVVFINIYGSMKEMGSRFEMSLYLREGLSKHETEYLYTLLKGEPGVKKVAYLSKDEALALFKKDLKGQEVLLDGLEENPLPDSFEITIDRRYADATRLDAMAKRFITFPGVEDISYGKQGVKTLSRLLRLFTYGGIAVAVLLSISVVFIVSNSVRLALYSRGMEVELMQWIGATKRFISGPFLMEGMLLGILGTGLAVGVLAGIYYALPEDLVLFMTGPKGMDFLPVEVIAYMALGGLVLGFAGALVSVGRFLE